MLELFGLIVVAVGLRDRRKRFGQLGLLQRVLAWFSRLVSAFRRPPPIIVPLEPGHLGLRGGEVSLKVSPAAGASVERRLELLEAEMERLRGEIDANTAELNEALEALKRDLGYEREARRKADTETASKIEEISTGGIRIEVIGALWLAVGLFAANAPDELLRLFPSLKSAFQSCR
jgi:hypothetical protein